MRGADIEQSGMFSYVSMESRIPASIRCGGFERCWMRRSSRCTGTSSASTPLADAVDGPGALVRALVLQVLYSIRSERLLVEQLDYNLLFRWFVGLSVDDRIWDHSSFTKNRDRLIEAGVARKLLRRVGASSAARGAALLGALQRGWDADRGLVGGQEHAPARRQGRSAAPGTQPARGLPRRAAQQRDARGPARAAGEAVSQGQGSSRPSSTTSVTC